MHPRPTNIWPFLLTALLLLPGPARGQDRESCRAALSEFPEVTGAEDTRRPCLLLANFLRTRSTAVQDAARAITQVGAVDPGSVFSERDLQQKNPSDASMAGSLAQGEATPSVAPTALASGSLAAVGSEAGDDALVALGLNPIVLFFIDEASEALAKYSRFMDLSVFVPVTDIDEQSPDPDGLEYLGLRLRLNWLGLNAGDELWAAADSLITEWLTQAGRDVQEILTLLREAPDLRACALALANNEAPSVQTMDCGRLVNLSVDAAGAAQLGRELDRIRENLDTRYLGADIRVDWGDPTLGAVDGASGTFLFGGLAYGRRLIGGADAETSVGIRARAGARHATLDVDESTAFSYEVGLGFEITRTLGQQQVSAAFGVDARYGDGPAGTDDRVQSDFTVLRGSLVIPVTDSNNLSLTLGVPVDGELEQFLSVKFDWRLLLPDTSPIGGS